MTHVSVTTFEQRLIARIAEITNAALRLYDADEALDEFGTVGGEAPLVSDWKAAREHLRDVLGRKGPKK